MSGLGLFAHGRFSATDFPQSSGPITAIIENTDRMRDDEGADGIAEAYTRRLQDVPVQAEGRVVKVLPDDNQGTRYQHFCSISAMDIPC